MQFIYRLLRKDPEKREDAVLVTSSLGILINLLMATVKIIVGTLVSSIAVVSEGINNAADSVTSLLAIIGMKLSQRHPTKDHPFGFGRIEYLTSLVISSLIVFAGIEFLLESIKLIFHPAELSISYGTLTIVAIFAVVKFILGVYTIRTGRRVQSSSLVAVGTESRSDAFVSIVTILSALIFIFSGTSVDAYAGVITSLFILKAGVDVLLETLGALLGQSADKNFADQLYQEIRKTPGVLNAADMMIHNYGPDHYSGSVNLELAHDRPLGEIYPVIHELQLRLMHKWGITMVFGLYAVDTDHELYREIRKKIADFVRVHEHVTGFHALYLPAEEKRIYCDFVVDYSPALDWDALRTEFAEYLRKDYPEYELELVIETEFV